MSTKRDLVLTTAVRYDAAALRPFVSSWKRHLPGADLVVFANHLSPETAEWLLGQGARLLPADLQLFPARSGWRYALHWGLLAASSRLFGSWLRHGAGLDRVQARLIRLNLLGLVGARWRHFLLFLRLHRSAYRQVLFVDARDTVFQGDPFPVDGLHVFAENGPIGASHFARRWFQLTYGTATWRRLGSRPFLCAGTTLGDAERALAYAELMSEHCLRFLTLGGEDQAVHNFLVHTGAVAATINAFGDGVAINLNQEPRQRLRVRSGQLVDVRDRPFPIVHQYDRVPGLAGELTECRAG